MAASPVPQEASASAMSDRRRRSAARSALLRNGDRIMIDAEQGHDRRGAIRAELASRRAAWQPRRTDYNAGAIWKYAQLVGPAHLGAVTHRVRRPKGTATRTSDRPPPRSFPPPYPIARLAPPPVPPPAPPVPPPPPPGLSAARSRPARDPTAGRRPFLTSARPRPAVGQRGRQQGVVDPQSESVPRGSLIVPERVDAPGRVHRPHRIGQPARAAGGTGAAFRVDSASPGDSAPGAKSSSVGRR